MEKYFKNKDYKNINIDALVISNNDGAKSGGTSEIQLLTDHTHKYILKKIVNNKVLLYWKDSYEDGIELLKNEYEYLNLIDKYIYFPTLFSYDLNKATLLLSYVGNNVLNTDKIPNDWKTQLKDIYTILKEHDIYHNDIFGGNICILDNRIYLIDFGQTSSNTPNYPWFNLSLKFINNSDTIYEMFEKILNAGINIIASLYIHNKTDNRLN